MDLTARQYKEQLLKEKLKRAALKSFPVFVEEIINYDKHWDIQPFQYEMMEMFQENPYILGRLPRGHGKTELITISMPIWWMCKNPNVKMLILNENTDNAEKFLSAIKDVLTKNERLIYFFGEFKSDEKWSSDQIIIRQRTQTGMKDPTIAVAGSEKSVVGGHFNKIIFDDIVSDKNSETYRGREQLIDLYKNTFPLQDPNDFEWKIIGTSWYYGDLYDYIERTSSLFKIYTLSAVEGGDLEKGKILFPKLFNREKLKQLKKDMGSYQFSAQYLNKPVDDEDATFKQIWIDRMFSFIQGGYIPSEDRWEHIPKNINTFVLLDPAISETKRSDFTSLLVVSMDAQRRAYIRKIMRDKMSYQEMINNVFLVNEEFHPVLIGIETNAFQKILLQLIDSEVQEREIPLPIMGYSHHRDKNKRIEKIQPFFERGDIFCDRRIENADYLEYELSRFPKAEHDDVIDTLASFVEIAFPPDPEQILGSREVDQNQVILNIVFNQRREVDEDPEYIEDLISANEDYEDFFQ